MTSPMRFLFRADASSEIGSGHITRCASLAGFLAANGHEVQFVCRELDGDLNSWLDAEGFRVNRISGNLGSAIAELEDAQATAQSLQGRRHDWLIVDHYSLGAAWERAMAAVADRIFVVDDLGRRHDCQLLLDQNYGNPAHALYPSRVPSQCKLLLGAEFALLRPEFSALRAASLGRRRGELSRLLVFMGGGDPGNETCKALAGIARSAIPAPSVDIVIGGGNPHRLAVEQAAASLARAKVHVQTGEMAQLMKAADCAIAAPGSAAWERCALGLPALVTILADNQVPIADALGAAGAHRVLGRQSSVTADDYARALSGLDAAALSAMSSAAAKICDGRGVERVISRLYSGAMPELTQEAC